MRNKKRSVLGLVAALAVASAALFVAGPTQAATDSADSKAGHVMVLPAAPHGVTPKSTAANSPGISPAADKVVHVAFDDHVVCTSGNFCTAVWDPTTNDWKVFFLFTCRKYYLSYWQGDGTYMNSQTGGAVAIFYGQNGNELKRIPAGEAHYPYNWDPVWSIRNC